jgi:hypothetical protein
LDFEDFLFDANERYAHYHDGREFDENQVEWMQAIYEEYADEDGFIDWSNKSYDSAWYMYLSEVLDVDEEDIERYMNE